MLVKLGCLAKAAQRIEDSKEIRTPFGYLHIVLRDNPDLTGVREQLLEDEGAGYAIRGKPLPEDFVQRNQIRALLKQAFKSIQLWGLPPPVENTTQPFTIADASDDFISEVSKLRSALCIELMTPHTLEGKPLTGVLIAGMADALSLAVNENAGCISPSSAFSAMQHIEVRHLEQSLGANLGEYIDALCDAVGKMPHAEEELDRLFGVARNDRIERYRTTAGLIVSDSQIKEGVTRLTQVWSEELTRLLNANEKTRLKLKSAQDDVLMELANYASNRKAELEEQKNIKDKEVLLQELKDVTRRLLDEAFPAALAACGLQGTFLETREKIFQVIMDERKRIVKANRNANCRANGEVRSLWH